MLGDCAGGAREDGAMEVGMVLSRHSDSVMVTLAWKQSCVGWVAVIVTVKRKAPAEGARLTPTDFFLPLAASQQTCWVMTGSSAYWNVCLSCPSLLLLSK